MGNEQVGCAVVHIRTNPKRVLPYVDDGTSNAGSTFLSFESFNSIHPFASWLFLSTRSSYPPVLLRSTTTVALESRDGRICGFRSIQANRVAEGRERGENGLRLVMRCAPLNTRLSSCLTWTIPQRCDAIDCVEHRLQP